MTKLLCAILFLSLCGCFQTENSSAHDEGTYDGNISADFMAAKMIFSSHCLPCHANYPANSVAEFIAQGLLVPGSAETSLIYTRIIGSSGSLGNKDMPQSGSPPSAANVEAIATWINNITP